MKEKLVIIGTSTTAKHVYEFVKGYELFEVCGFAVDDEYRQQESFCGLPVYGLGRLEEQFDMQTVQVFVALLWNRLNGERRKLYERMKEKGYRMANLISPTAVIRGTLAGDNCWIHDYVIIQPETIIGADCMLMAFALIGADVVLGNHCFMGTKSTVAGNCRIGDQTFIGINSTVFDDTQIGRKCIVGACTIVKRNMQDCTLIKTGRTDTDTVVLNEDTIEEKLLYSRNVRETQS